MRARFTDSIASADWDYSVGTEVLIEGLVYARDRVPEKVGRSWLSSGLLVAIGPESAALRSTETAAQPTAKARPVPARA